jgi:hypothetical protein
MGVMPMSADWVTGIKDGYETKIVQVGNCTVRIHSPILDDQERAKREEQVRDALKGLIKKEL